MRTIIADGFNLLFFGGVSVPKVEIKELSMECFLDAGLGVGGYDIPLYRYESWVRGARNRNRLLEVFDKSRALKKWDRSQLYLERLKCFKGEMLYQRGDYILVFLWCGLSKYVRGPELFNRKMWRVFEVRGF